MAPIRILWLCLVCASQWIFAMSQSPPTSADSWHQYVIAPSSSTIKPASVHSVSGDVTNPEVLLASSSGGVTTFSRATANTPTPILILDFGQDVVGYLQFTFAGASSSNGGNPGIRLAFSETLQFLSNVSDFSRSDNGQTITPGSDQFAVPSGSETVVWTDTYGCLEGNQVCADGLHGFRYMRISLDALASDAPFAVPFGEVNISSITLNFTAFLGTPDTFTGYFECSDTNLTQYWFDAAYTNELTTDHFRMNDTEPRDAFSPFMNEKLVLFDGAKRDRDPYVGDLGVSSLTAFLTHDGTSEGVRTVLEDLIQHQRSDGWIPPASINAWTLPLFDYPLWWVVVGWNYVLYTRNVSFAETYYPNVLAVLNDFYPSVTNTSNGLLSKGLAGTSGYGDYAFLPRSGEVTYYNSLYVLALQSASKIATLVNDSATVATWTTRANAVSTAINANLWDASVGAYLDSAVGAARHAQDGNGISILAGVANSTRASSALNYLSNTTELFYGNAFMDNDSIFAGASQRVYAFISFFDISARFKTFGPQSSGPGSAIEEIHRLYSWMSTNDPTHTFWEGIGPDGSMYEDGFTSASHGWSTGVLPALTNFVLGVEPLSVGFATWSVRPHPSGLAWARGRIGTPSGPLDVTWTSDPNSFTVVVDAPPGTTGTISLPILFETSNISMDGAAVETTVDMESGYVAVDNVQGGSQHEIVMTKA